MYCLDNIDNIKNTVRPKKTAHVYVPYNCGRKCPFCESRLMYDTMDTSGRPLAQQGRQDFLDRFAQREPIYRACADYVITDFSSPDNTLNAILEVLQ